MAVFRRLSSVAFPQLNMRSASQKTDLPDQAPSFWLTVVCWHLGYMICSHVCILSESCYVPIVFEVLLYGFARNYFGGGIGGGRRRRFTIHEIIKWHFGSLFDTCRQKALQQTTSLRQQMLYCSTCRTVWGTLPVVSLKSVQAFPKYYKLTFFGNIC